MSLSITISLVVLLGVFSTFLTYRSVMEIEREVYEKNREIAKGIEAKLDTTFEGIEDLMSTITRLEGVTALNTEVLDDLLKDIVNEYGLISQMYVMDTTGMQIYKTSGELGDRATRGYFQEAMKGRMNYSDVLISGSTGEPIIVIAAPIKEGDTIVGVLGASVDLSMLSEVIINEALGEEGYTFIVDRNGSTIAHPKREHVEEMLDATFLEPVRKVIQGEENVIEYEYNNVKKLASYVYLERMEWGIVTQIPRDVALASVRMQMVIVIVGIILSIVFGAILSIIIANSITKPLGIIKDGLERAAQGDFSQNISGKIVKRKDELGILAHSYQVTMGSMKQIISDIKETADKTTESSAEIIELSRQMGIASDEVATTVTEIAEGATMQATRTAEGLDITLKMSGTVNDMGEKSGKLRDEAVTLKENNTSVSEAFEEVENVFDSTKVTSEDTKLMMDKLMSKSEEIVDIVTTIRTISEQTSLLALNASIEAARAGENGKGFSVVATEIKKLSEESQASTDEIDVIIRDISDFINQTGGMIKKNSEAITLAGDSIESAKEKVDAMFLSNEAMTTEVDALNMDINNVETLKSDVLEAIESIASIAEESAASTQEISASTEEQAASVSNVVESISRLNDSIVSLKASIAVFKV